jgi:UDP-glucose 4-epimerase
VHDVVRGVLMLAREPRAIGEVFNIGTQEEVTVADLARRVKALTGSMSAIEMVEYEAVYGSRFEDMQRRVPSLDKIRALVGYEPEVTLDQLLHDTVEHVRQEQAGPLTGSVLRR